MTFCTHYIHYKVQHKHTDERIRSKSGLSQNINRWGRHRISSPVYIQVNIIPASILAPLCTALIVVGMLYPIKIMPLSRPGDRKQPLFESAFSAILVLLATKSRITKMMLCWIQIYSLDKLGGFTDSWQFSIYQLGDSRQC